MRTRTHIAGDSAVSGENRRFGVFYCLHELVECCIEGQTLLWSVGDGATLKRYVSEFTRTVSNMTRAHPDATDLWIGLEHEGCHNSLYPS